MSKQVPWNKIIVEEFVSIASLTKDEEAVLRTRAAGWSRTKQCMEFNMSMSTLDRIIRRLKVKYDHAQKYSVILPPRRFSAEETYMDTH